MLAVPTLAAALPVGVSPTSATQDTPVTSAFYPEPKRMEEFVFRFNHRKSRSRELVFFRLLELAVGHHSVRYDNLVAGERPRKTMPTPPLTNGHPPSLDRQPAGRPWRGAHLVNSV